MAYRSRLTLFAILGIGVALVMMRSSSPSALPVATAGPAQLAAPTARPWFAADAAQALLPARYSAPSLSQKIDKLIASGRPEDAFSAYILVRDCSYFQQWKTLPFIGFPGPIRDMTDLEQADEATLCDGMSERIKMDSIDHLAVAAQAGVMGADSAFMQAGPFGDPSALVSRPDDPLVVAWKAQALAYVTVRARDADMGSLMTLTAAYSSGNDVIAKDPALALAYAIAIHKIQEQFALPPGTLMPFNDTDLAWMEDGLSAQQIAAADADGAKIADVFRARRAAAQ